jgi:acyl carrier protein
MKERFLEFLEEVLERDQSTLSMNDECEEWDSLAVLSVLAMINEEFNITIPRKDFQNFQTVEDLYNYTMEKQGTEE